MLPTPLAPRSVNFLLVAILLITLPHSQHLAWPLFGFFMLMWLWRAAAQRWPQLLPGRWLLLLLLLSGIGVLVSMHNGLFGRDAGTGVLMVALGLKLLEIRSKRDADLVAYLAFILAASQFLYDQSLWLALYVVTVSAGLLTTLITQNVQQIHTRKALRSSLLILLQAVPLGILMFLVFPRFQAPHWSWLNSDNKARSGLGREMEPGSIADLSMSDELVFRAQFKGAPPENNQRYWRGIAYSWTDGKRWMARDLSKSQLQTVRCQGARYEYSVLLEPQREAWVLGLDRVTQWPTKIHIDGQQQLTRSDLPSERAEYALSSCTDYQLNASVDERRINLQLPALPSAKIRALIQQLQGNHHQPLELANNLLSHFKHQNFHYTLQPPLLPDNPIEGFLFETRAGFCSHYATAFVYVLRAAGIPARVIGGYQGGSFNPNGNFIEVRQADAHAWAEVWLDSRGWVRFDPTSAISPERIERGVDIAQQLATGAVNYLAANPKNSVPDWLQRSRQLFANADYQWQHWIIHYDRDLQNQLLSGLGLGQLAELVSGLAGALLLIGLGLFGWLLKGRKPRISPVLAQYQRFCKKLTKAGLSIETGEGARDFALRAQQARPDLAPAIARITALFIRLYYEAEPQRADLGRLKQAVKALRV